MKFTRILALAAVVVVLGGAVLVQQHDRLIVNLNDNIDATLLGPLYSNASIPSGAGLVVIGPDEEAPGEPPVDHTRIVQYGFGIDPIYSCYFSNGSADDMTAVQKNETLCTFQARGCESPDGCTIEGDGFGLSTVQLRISATENWSPGSKGTRVMLSTTQAGTANEWTKVIWDDGGHIEYGNFEPSVGSGCGSGASLQGTDNAFRLTIGSGPSSTCTVTFNNAWTLAYSGQSYRPICTVNNENRAGTFATPATGSIAIKGAFSAGDDIDVICVGRHDWPAQ